MLTSIARISLSGCACAEALRAIAQRLRQKRSQAQSSLVQAGYAQASLEITRESIKHDRECNVCQSQHAEQAATDARNAQMESDRVAAELRSVHTAYTRTHQSEQGAA